jgi:hypothetical protein
MTYSPEAISKLVRAAQLARRMLKDRALLVRAVLVLMALPGASITHAQVPPELEAIVGVYRGEALNGSDLDPVTTTFRLGSGGRLVGEYVIEDELGTFHGTISNAYFENGTLYVEWTDRDGEGYAELGFSNDFRSFDGFWGSLDSQNENPWTGVRQ